MSCEDYKADLSAYLDGELDAARRGAVDAHLASCGECRAELERLRALTGLLQGVPKARAPGDLARKIAAAAARERAPKILQLKRYIPAVAVAAAVMLAAIIGLSSGPGEPVGDRHSPLATAPRYAAPAATPAEKPDTAEVPESGPGGDRFEITVGAAAQPALAAEAAPPAGQSAAPVVRDAGARPVTAKAAAPTAAGARDRASAPAPTAARPAETSDASQSRPRATHELPAAEPLQDRDEGLVGTRIDATTRAQAVAGPAKEKDEVATVAGQGRRQAPAPAAADATVPAADENVVLHVRLQAADGAAEQARVERIARLVGGMSAPEPDAPADLRPAPVERKADAAAARRLSVRVPAARTDEFLAVLEGLASADDITDPSGLQLDEVAREGESTAGGAGATANAGPSDEPGTWTRIEIAIVGVAPAVAGAEAPSPDARRETQADLARKRMEQLLSGSSAAKPGAPTAPTSTARVDTMLRFHLVPFRGDVAGEAWRVQQLAIHYGGRVVFGGVEKAEMLQRVEPERNRAIRFSMPAESAAEFIEAARLGVTAPATTGARAAEPAPAPDGAAQPATASPDAPADRPARPIRWVAVEVTIGDEAPEAGRR